MADASTVRVTFLGDAQSLARAAKLAQGQMEKVSKSVGKATKIGAFFGSAAGNLAATGLGKIQAFATGSVDAFARIEDATGAAGVQFGDQLPVITQFANEAAKNFGISKGAALDAANTFGTLGKAAGLGGTDLSGFATDLSGLAGDLASFKGTSTEQAIGAVGAALRGESEPIRAYGIMLDEATLKAEAMSMGLLKTTKNADAIKAAQMRASLAQKSYNAAVREHGAESTEAQRAQLSLTTAQTGLKKATEGTVGPLTTSQKILAAQSAIAKQSSDAQGDFARTADSTANTQKRLAAETENAQAKLGEALAPAVTAVREIMLKAIKVVSGLANGISGLVGFVNENRTAFGILAGVITAVMLPAMIGMIKKYTVLGVQATISAAKQTAAWLAAQMGAYKSIAAHAAAFAAMIAGWVRAGAQAMIQAARMAAAWLIAMGPIALVIAAVVGAVVLIIKNWDKIKAATVKVWNAVKAAVQKAISTVITILTNFTGPGLIIKHFDKIKSGVSDAISKVVGFMTKLPGRIIKAVGDLGTTLKDAGWDVIEGFVNGLKDGATGLIQKAIDWALDKIPGWAKKVLGISSPSKVMIPIGERVSEGVAVGIQKGSGAVEKATEKMAEKVEGLADRLREHLGTVRDFAKDIRAQFRDLANVTSIDTMFTDAAGEQREGGFVALLDGLRKKAADAQKFAAAMGQLRKQGLNQTTLDQLREAGPDGGLAAAQNLLTGGMGGIGEVNRLMAQINKAGTAFAATETKARYGIGPDAKLSNRDVRLIVDSRGGEDEFKKWIRKWIRSEGGNVQKVMGAL